MLWRRAKKTIRDTRTRDFFYRLLNGLLFANKDLHRFGIKPSGICPECDEQTQTVRHLMWECEGTRSTRGGARNELQCQWPVNMELSDLKDLNDRDLAIWIKVMHSIYLNNIYGSPQTWHVVKGALTDYCLTQKLIAEKRDKMVEFLGIWNNV